MKRILLTVALALGVFPSTGVALTLDSTRPKIEAWINASKIPTPRVNVHVEWNLNVCPDAWACVDIHRGAGSPLAITMHMVDRGPRSVDQEAFYHEVGHVLDAALFTEADRDEFRRVIRDWREWEWGGQYSPSEKFANAYSWCALNGPGEKADLSYSGYRIGPKTQGRVCRLMVRVMGRGR